MEYKAIALDIDGTLTNSKKEISKKTKEAVMEAAKRGVKIIVASGRPIPGIMKIASALKLKEVGGYILSYNGGLILDCKTGEVIRRETIPTEYYYTIVNTVRKSGVAVLTYDQKGIITEWPDDEYVQIEAKINHIPVRHVSQLEQRAAEDPVVKFLVVGHPKDLKPVYEKLNQKLDGAVNIFFSEPYFMEITPQGIEKASSLELLLDQIGIDRRHLMACGDGFNDIQMLQYAGLSVAMGNAQPETKEFADYIAPDNDHDGVADAIHKFILK